MDRRLWVNAAGAAITGLTVAACASGPTARPPVALPQPPPAAAVVARPADPVPPIVTPAPDPVDAIIAQSQARFAAGEAQLALGHLGRAKAEFDAAVDLVLESPAGARSSRRLQEHFDRLVDRISAFEMRTLAEGDGFAENPTVPASIDQLLDQPTPDPATPRPEIRDVVAADLEATPHDVPIPLNTKVLSWIEAFQGRLREWFQISMQRGMPYLPMIQNIFRTQGLPLDLAYIPIVESAFRTDALSRASARGFWQLMKGTASAQGLIQDWYIDERSNPEKATQAAAKYLKWLVALFDGDWHLALASYNGGPGYIQRALKRRGQTEFWGLAQKAGALPRETREYVPMVLASIVIARNPALYGFTFEPVAPPEYETVTLSGPVDLRKVAEWTGVSLADIQRLNPELLRFTTPVNDKPYRLRVPAATAGIVEQRIGELPPEELAPLRWYTVRLGESLTSIANKLRVRRTSLAEANYLKVGAGVTPGQKLVIPLAPGTLLASSVAPSPAPVRASAPAAATPPGDRVKSTYVVQKGDTLFSIAQQFHTTVATLRSWNNLKGDRIVPGERLTIYTSR